MGLICYQNKNANVNFVGFMSQNKSHTIYSSSREYIIGKKYNPDDTHVNSQLSNDNVMYYSLTC